MCNPSAFVGRYGARYRGAGARTTLIDLKNGGVLRAQRDRRNRVTLCHSDGGQILPTIPMTQFVSSLLIWSPGTRREGSTSPPSQALVSSLCHAEEEPRACRTQKDTSFASAELWRFDAIAALYQDRMQFIDSDITIHIDRLANDRGRGHKGGSSVAPCVGSPCLAALEPSAPSQKSHADGSVVSDIIGSSWKGLSAAHRRRAVR